MKILYLDTSDFGTLVSAKERSVRVKKHLESLIEKGDLEIRFSAAHLFEMLQVEPSQADYARPRLAVLAQLCQGKCFRQFDELLNLEVKAFLENRKLQRSEALCEKDGWMQEFLEIQEPGFVSEFRSFIRSINSRYARRTLSKKLGIKTRSPSIADIFEAAARAKVIKTAPGLMGIVEFAAFLSDGLPDQRVSIMPEKWCDFWQHHVSGGGRNFRQLIADQGASFAELVKKQREQIRQKFTEQRGSLDWATLRQAYLDCAGTLVLQHEFYPELAEALGLKCGKSEWNSAIRFLGLEETSGIRAFQMAYHNYMAENHLKDPGTPKAIQDSDFLDIQHMTYIPYCDYFRADSNQVHSAKQVASAHNCQIIETFDDLLML